MFPCSWVVGPHGSQNKGHKAEQQPWIKIQPKRSLTVNSEEGTAHSDSAEVTSSGPVLTVPHQSPQPEQRVLGSTTTPARGESCAMAALLLGVWEVFRKKTCMFNSRICSAS